MRALAPSAAKRSSNEKSPELVGRFRATTVAPGAAGSRVNPRLPANQTPLDSWNKNDDIESRSL
jgi:hypothetical protein